MTEAFPRVSIPQTEDRRLFSQQVGIEYQLAVWLPADYVSSGQRYPVFYALDGDLCFGLVTSLILPMNWTYHVPEMIIVGIGYNCGLAEWGSLREKDFKIPEVQSDPPDSHADVFLSALKTEILPFVDANYRTDPQDRALFGYSSSGFFTLFALLNEPDLFQHYLAGSPDTDLSYPYLLAHDQKLAQRDAPTPLDLFLTIGDQENGAMQSSLDTFNQLSAVLQAHKYPGLRWTAQIYAGENHGAGGMALTFIQGLRQIYV
jgi:uncharacterized protein